MGEGPFPAFFVPHKPIRSPAAPVFRGLPPFYLKDSRMMACNCATILRWWRSRRAPKNNIAPTISAGSFTLHRLFAEREASVLSVGANVGEKKCVKSRQRKKLGEPRPEPIFWMPSTIPAGRCREPRRATSSRWLWRRFPTPLSAAKQLSCALSAYFRCGRNASGSAAIPEQG